MHVSACVRVVCVRMCCVCSCACVWAYVLGVFVPGMVCLRPLFGVSIRSVGVFVPEMGRLCPLFV